MLSFYEQFLTLLTTTPGNLTYHLVLVFAIAGALPGALGLWQNTGAPQARRLLVGLGMLLLGQLALIVFAGLARFFIIPVALLPTLDRAVTAFSLVMLIWLWVFPEPQRRADFASLLLILVILVLAVFSAVWWSGQPQENGFNGLLADMVWAAFNGALALVGGIMLYVRRPPGYEIGLGMFGLLFLGQAVHLVFPRPAGDFPGVVRLSQLAAFPLLLTLPYRQLTLVIGSQGAPARRTAGIDPDAYQAFLDLATHSEPQEIYQAITRSVAYALNADLCLLISPPDSQNVITVYCGYNQSRREDLGTATFDSTLVPVLSEALRQSRPLHLPADSKLPDLDGLSKMFDLKLAGSVLAAPIASQGDTPAMALLLLSPYTRRVWSVADQNYLADIARALVEVLRRSQGRRALEDSLDQTSRALQSLQSENERLSLAVDDLSAQKALFPEIQELQEQLRLALEEIATLQNALMVSDLRVTAADSTEVSQPEPQPETQT